MSVRHRRHASPRFWALLTIVVLIVVGIVVLTHRHRPVAALRPRATVSAPHLALGRWTVDPVTLSQPVAGFSAVATANAIWVLGGLVNRQSTALVQKLNLGNQNQIGTIEDITPGLPVALHDAAAVVRGQSILLLGGGSYTSSATVFSLPLPKLSPAVTLTPLPLPLSDLAAVNDGSRVLVIGGHDQGAPSSAIWSYVPGQPVRVFAHLPEGVRYAAAAAYHGTLYVIGGLNGNAQPTNQAVAYHLASHQMVRLPPYPIPVQHAEATVIDGTLVVAGGQTDAGWISAVYWFDSHTHRWVSGPSLPEPAGDGALLTLSHGMAVWLGGDGPSGPTGSIWTIHAVNKR